MGVIEDKDKKLDVKSRLFNYNKIWIANANFYCKDDIAIGIVNIFKWSRLK